MATRPRQGIRDQFSGDALLKRTAEAHQRMNEYGKYGRFYTAPEGGQLKIWKCREGEHLIDIIPFIAGSNHLQVDSGKPTYVVDVWIHQKVGINENDYLCLTRNYREPCPICEFLAKKRMEALTDKEEKVLKTKDPKRRCLYNIVCYDSARERDKGVQLWEIAHFLFEKKVLAIAREPQGGGFIPFSSPDNGKAIYFEREGSGLENTQYLGYKFVDRQRIRDYITISNELLESAYILDELVHKPDYAEVHEALYCGLGGAPIDEGREKAGQLGQVPRSAKKPDPEKFPSHCPSKVNRVQETDQLKPQISIEEQKGISQPSLNNKAVGMKPTETRRPLTSTRPRRRVRG